MNVPGGGQYVNVQVEDEPSGLRHRPSARSTGDDADDLVQRLPSRQLGENVYLAVQKVIGAISILVFGFHEFDLLLSIWPL